MFFDPLQTTAALALTVRPNPRGAMGRPGPATFDPLDASPTSAAYDRAARSMLDDLASMQQHGPSRLHSLRHPRAARTRGWRTGGALFREASRAISLFTDSGPIVEAALDAMVSAGHDFDLGPTAAERALTALYGVASDPTFMPVVHQRAFETLVQMPAPTGQEQRQTFEFHRSALICELVAMDSADSAYLGGQLNVLANVGTDAAVWTDLLHEHVPVDLLDTASRSDGWYRDVLPQLVRLRAQRHALGLLQEEGADTIAPEDVAHRAALVVDSARDWLSRIDASGPGAYPERLTLDFIDLLTAMASSERGLHDSSTPASDLIFQRGMLDGAHRDDWAGAFAIATRMDLDNPDHCAQWTLDPRHARLDSFRAWVSGSRPLGPIPFDRFMAMATPARESAAMEPRAQLDGDRILHDAALHGVIPDVHAFDGGVGDSAYLSLRRVRALVVGWDVRRDGVLSASAAIEESTGLGPELAREVATFLPSAPALMGVHAFDPLPAERVFDQPVWRSARDASNLVNIWPDEHRSLWNALRLVEGQSSPLPPHALQGPARVHRVLTDGLVGGLIGSARVAEAWRDGGVFERIAAAGTEVEHPAVAREIISTFAETFGIPMPIPHGLWSTEQALPTAHLALGHDDTMWMHHELATHGSAHRDQRDGFGRRPLDVALARPDGADRIRLLAEAGYDTSVYDISATETRMLDTEAQRDPARSPLDDVRAARPSMRTEALTFGGAFLEAHTALNRDTGRLVAEFVGERRWLVELRARQGRQAYRDAQRVRRAALRDHTGLSDRAAECILEFTGVQTDAVFADHQDS